MSNGGCWFLDRVASKGLLEEGTAKQRLGWWDGASHGRSQRKRAPGRDFTSSKTLRQKWAWASSGTVRSGRIWGQKVGRARTQKVFNKSWVNDYGVGGCCSVAKSCLTLFDPMDCSMLGSPVLHYLPEFAQSHVHWWIMLCNHLILCHPSLLLPSIFPRITVFPNESAFCIKWPKHWSFSFSIGPSNEYSGLISFRIDWFDIFGIQGTFKSLLQHHDSKTAILWHSAFFMVQLSHPYMTPGKNHNTDYTDLCWQSDVSAF